MACLGRERVEVGLRERRKKKREKKTSNRPNKSPPLFPFLCLFLPSNPHPLTRSGSSTAWTTLAPARRDARATR